MKRLWDPKELVEHWTLTADISALPHRSGCRPNPPNTVIASQKSLTDCGSSQLP